MRRTLILTAAAIAALSLAACGKPAEKTDETTLTTPDTSAPEAASADASGGHSADGVGSVGTADTGGGSSTGGVTGTDTGPAPAMTSGAPEVDPTKSATATTPTAKVPLETTRKNNPPPNQ